MRFTVCSLSLLTANVLVIIQREGLASAFLPSFCRPPPSLLKHKPFLVVRPRIDATLFTSTDDYVLDANDVELLQKVFAKYSDKDGLMTRDEVMQVPAISQLLKDGDLMPEELTEIWDNAPKFPDVKEDRIDVDSFVQVYRTIDDMFESEDEEGDQTPAPSSVVDEESAPEEESVLVEVFASIAQGGTLTKDQLKGWDEISTLIADNMLGEDEFDQLWKDACKSETTMDEGAFLQFNDRLDSLFEFDDEDLDEVIDDLADEIEETAESGELRKPPDVVEGDVEPEELFALLKSRDGVVGVKQLKRWGELQEMLTDEDILPSEVDDIFEKALRASKVDGALDQTGFTAFYQAINDLFEEDEDDADADIQKSEGETVGSSSLKEDLLRALNVMNNDDERLPCGLESTEKEEKLILDLVTELENEKTNFVRINGDNIGPSDLTGEWEMLYTSSSSMKFNKGLSGIGGSFPNGKFGGLKQKLKVTAVLSDVEYREFIQVNPSASSFDVKIDGNWDLRKSTSLFTGEPSIVLSVEPNRVTYGPTSTRADHWKSLGPMNLLDVAYLDDEIRIMRGNTAVDTIFVFKRLK